MFTYSSWSSRSWLIIRGAQPAVQQQQGLNALKRLYEAKGFDPTFSVTFGVDSGQNLHVSLSCRLFLRTLVIVVDVLLCVCMQLAQNHGGVHGHQSPTLRRISANYEPRDAGAPSQLHQRQ